MGRPRIYQLDPQYFYKIYSNEKAYVLGLIYADAHVSKAGITIAVKKEDEELLKYIKDELKSSHPIKNFQIKGRHYVRLSIACVQFSRDLRLPTNKSKNNLCWPRLNDLIYPSFLRGFFDGDGSVWKKDKSYASCFTGGKLFLEEIKKYLESNGIQSKLRFRYTKINEKSCMLDIKNSNNGLYKLYNLMYSDNGNSLSRKKRMFELAMARLAVINNTKYTTNGNDEKIWKLYQYGVTQKNISLQLNLPYSSVRGSVQRQRKHS